MPKFIDLQNTMHHPTARMLTRVPATNLKGLKQCLGWLKKGNTLITFPAGEVASYRPAKWRVVEPAWASHISALVRHSKATVLPLYFPGRNSNLFMLMGLLHPHEHK